MMEEWGSLDPGTTMVFPLHTDESFLLHFLDVRAEYTNQTLAEYSRQNGTDMDLFIVREDSCLCFPFAEVISSAWGGGLIPAR